MADMNPFDLLGDDELTEDPSQLIAAKKVSAQKPKPASQLPAKPLPPAQAVREAKPEPGQNTGRGYGRGRGFGRGRGGGFNREPANEENAPRNREFSGLQGAGPGIDARRPSERRGGFGGSRGSFYGGQRGGFAHGDLSDGERPRRVFDRHSGFSHGNNVTREGTGQGNWGTTTGGLALVIEEGVDEGEKDLKHKNPSVKEFTTDAKEGTPADDAGEKEPEEKEMTLEEYEKVLEEKRKALQALRTEERKVDTQVFHSMQPLNKKSSDDIFIQLGGKDKKKEYLEKEEKVKKSLSITEFLKPAEGEKFYPSGRGRGRGPNLRRGYGEDRVTRYMDVPSIEDPGQFPTLAGK
ncbi:RNA metabolism protein [Lithospermum erythrorhizon]|uniref:RNA metabolism protein n=1 Tax=Lithospermum erythrorhizon TaxID=34254 RepID=A0AAV3P4J2_LITER